jgi:hypothetical protein
MRAQTSRSASDPWRFSLGSSILIAVCSFSINAVAVRSAQAQGFSDGFEGLGINAFWTLTQQNGSIQLSSAVSHSGSQSVELTANGGGQVNVWLSHTFAGSTQGTLSVWIYDTLARTYLRGPLRARFH